MRNEVTLAGTAEPRSPNTLLPYWHAVFFSLFAGFRFGFAALRAKLLLARASVGRKLSSSSTQKEIFTFARIARHREITGQNRAYPEKNAQRSPKNSRNYAFFEAGLMKQNGCISKLLTAKNSHFLAIAWKSQRFWKILEKLGK